MIAFDVADGFYHLAIRERERHFFAFWMDEEVWRMAALPMGWSASPATFTAFMHPVFAYLTRASGRRRTGTPLATRRYPAMRGIPYVDDFIFFLGPEDRPAEEVRALLDQLGLAYKEEKCTWTPTTRLYHLGLVIDLERGRFVVPDEKAKAIQFTARDLIVRAKQNRRQVSSRDLASFVGRAMACELAIAPGGLVTHSVRMRATISGSLGSLRRSGDSHSRKLSPSLLCFGRKKGQRAAQGRARTRRRRATGQKGHATCTGPPRTQIIPET